ncbi:exopolysaccharide Pel transporter PelG [uncultured Cohaesibacter sp.]|uniref:exopolysaccharide Pel transporter PelG n=1 Tax=uncultured Cohaesibacter sp. TaxID=1002546 RepID=UPI0029311ECA|nr:exopolysaccharide Pel transporter PelG [uncultured Cohaesibacter sp.]
MAGIGFKLQKIARQQGLFSGFSAYGHAAVIVAGPWIFTIIAVALISISTEKRLGIESLANFRIVLIYAFALSIIATAPVVIIATRMVSDMFHARSFDRVSHVLFAALFFGLLLTGLASFLVLVVYFNIDRHYLPPAIFINCLIALIWIVLAFSGAIRDYAAITIGFAVGLSISIMLAIWSAGRGGQPIDLLWAFSVGLCFTFFWILVRILRTFQDAIQAPFSALRLMLRVTRQHWILAVGSLISMIAVWADKFVMWIAPTGEKLAVGLVHAPIYDSAMFLAYLVIIPSLASFMIHIETNFFLRFKVLHKAIENHATLKQIEDLTRQLATSTQKGLWQILLVQGLFCLLAIFMAPLIIEHFNFQFRQISIFRIGIIGALFQFLFLASSSTLLFLNQNKDYLKLQLLFLFLNTVFTVVTLHFESIYLGYGYLGASVVSGLVAYLLLENRLDNLQFHIFHMAATRSGENDWMR